MYEPSEDLLERLASADVTADDVMEFLNAQQLALADEDGVLDGTPEPGDFFNKETDLTSYQLAKEWWPTDVPVQWACPSIYQLCMNYHMQDEDIGHTFLERLRWYSNPVMAWLKEEGRDPLKPNQTDEEKKAAKNAERQKKHREAKKTEREEVSAAYQRYMEACRQRKAAAAEWDGVVEEAKAEWRKLKDQLDGDKESENETPPE